MGPGEANLQLAVWASRTTTLKMHAQEGAQSGDGPTGLPDCFFHSSQALADHHRLARQPTCKTAETRQGGGVSAVGFSTSGVRQGLETVAETDAEARAVVARRITIHGVGPLIDAVVAATVEMAMVVTVVVVMVVVVVAVMPVVAMMTMVTVVTVAVAPAGSVRGTGREQRETSDQGEGQQGQFDELLHGSNSFAGGCRCAVGLGS